MPFTNLYFNVLDYGAMGDGVTDDASAIQSAISAAQSQNGTVVFPPNTYLIGTPLVISASIAFLGSGTFDSVILKLNNGVNDYMVKFSPQPPGYVISGGMISNIRFDGNCSQQTAGGCIFAQGAVHWKFQACHFTSFYDIGLRLTNVPNQQFGHHNKVAFCLFDGASGSAGNGKGLQMDSCDENYIAFNDFENCGGAGSDNPSLKDWSGIQTIIGNVFVSGQEGIRVQDASGSKIIGNMFDGCGKNGIDINGSQVVVQGNVFSGLGSTNANTYSCVYLENGGQNVVCNNSFSTNVTPSGLLRSFIREGGTGANIISNNSFLVRGGVGTAMIEKQYATTQVRNNSGYITEASGTATINSGTTSVTINHGLGVTPNSNNIMVTPTNNLGNATKFWVSNITSTQFTINVNANPGAATAKFAWQALVL